MQPITYLPKSLDEGKIDMEIQYDKASSWQNISFAAMRVLSALSGARSIRTDTYAP
jgi:hypothetical protein